MERRVKILSIDQYRMFDMIQDILAGKSCQISANIPQGMKLVNVRENFQNRTFDLMVSHESFPEVPEGDLVPNLAIECTVAKDIMLLQEGPAPGCSELEITADGCVNCQCGFIRGYKIGGSVNDYIDRAKELGWKVVGVEEVYDGADGPGYIPSEKPMSVSSTRLMKGNSVVCNVPIPDYIPPLPLRVTPSSSILSMKGNLVEGYVPISTLPLSITPIGEHERERVVRVVKDVSVGDIVFSGRNSGVAMESGKSGQWVRVDVRTDSIRKACGLLEPEPVDLTAPAESAVADEPVIVEKKVNFREFL